MYSESYRVAQKSGSTHPMICNITRRP